MTEKIWKKSWLYKKIEFVEQIIEKKFEDMQSYKPVYETPFK